MTTPRLLSNRYEIGDTLGYGGMSEVHRGRDVRLGREVAVKVLRADLARDPQFQERFRREAQNAAALNHPAIVAVYDTGETTADFGPLPYIVMEYVDGRTLRDIVKTEGPLPERRALEIMADVCAALDFSHRHGIVHRDVKPANVMITKQGAVKVMDFGIARAVADGQVAVTQTAAVIGTAQYLSPEQARGEAVDARSDVYATGCVLFELLTGEPPFTGDSPVAVAYQHVREDPKPPSALNPRVSTQLDAIVLKAMAKGAPNRYQSAAEMRNDIVRVLSGQRPAAPMVMTDDDRTSIMTQGRPAVSAGRHRHDEYNDYGGDYGAHGGYDEEEERRRRRRAWTIGLVAVLGVGIIAFLLWLLLTNDEEPSGADTFPVPSLVGMTESEARKTLNDQGFTGLEFVQVPCQPSPDGSQGKCGPDQVDKVIGTSPTAGTNIKKSDKLTIEVGAAADKIEVPDLANLTVDDAKKKLAEIGLTADPTTEAKEVDDEAQVDKVVETNPPAATSVSRGSAVKLIIGKAKALVNVTNFVGQPYDVAARNLETAGLTAQRKDVSSERPAGEVVDQSPKSGKVKPGTVIVLSVSSGEPATFKMINLDGMTVDEAQAALKERGWTGSFDITEQPAERPRDVGRIMEQEQGGGSDVAKNATIGIVIGKIGPTFG